MTPELIQPAQAHGFKSVCYKCSYVGLDATVARCPACQFPLIFEARRSEAFAPDIERIFDRASVRLGAPPLPGVDTEPRKAQLLIEARRRRAARQRAASEAAILAEERKRSRRAVALACMSALVAGVAAALLMSGGI